MFRIGSRVITEVLAGSRVVGGKVTHFYPNENIYKIFVDLHGGITIYRTPDRLKPDKAETLKQYFHG